MSADHSLLEPIRALHRQIRDSIRAACERQEVEALSRVADDGPGDTIYGIDKVGEAVLVGGLEREARRVGGILLVAEGIAGGALALPEGREASDCRYRVIVDPVDGTRSLMYQKRPAWILTAVAENRGDDTRLSGVELAVQTELPLLKQNLTDELWAIRGEGAHAERVNLSTGARSPLRLSPSRASTIEHGFAMVVRLFPGGREELAALDDELVEALLGPATPLKARCFEDQYPSTGGQLYELMSGRDRFIADLRPLMIPKMKERGRPAPLCCHPYDICTAVIAEELGVFVRSPEGGRLDCSLNLDEDVAWVGYANRSLLERIEPVLCRLLDERGLSRSTRQARA